MITLKVNIRHIAVLFEIACVATAIILTTQIFFMNRPSGNKNIVIGELSAECNPNASKDFTDFDNELGTPKGCYIVPNIIHFIRFTDEPISYMHMICYLAAYKNHKPDKIYFHSDNEFTFSGEYWDVLKDTPGFLKIVEFHDLEMPTEIFGEPFSDRFLEYHASDVARIQVLIKHGGIYLDNYLYVVQSLNDFRRYEMTLNWDDLPEVLATQVLLAHKDARFLQMWLESYRDSYKSQAWHFNAAVRPTYEILYNRPELIHRVKSIFGVNANYSPNIYLTYWPEWRNMYTIYLRFRHFNYLKSHPNFTKLPNSFDEINIKNCNITFREMALDVYNPFAT